MIGAFNTFQGRAAVADIAKVYGIPEREVRRFTEHLPYFMGDAEAVGSRPCPSAATCPGSEEPYRTILKMAAALRGHPAARLDAPLRAGDRRRAHHRPHAAVPQRQGLPDHALRHGRRRGTGAAEDGPAGAGGAERAARRAARTSARTAGVRSISAPIDYEDAATWEAIATGNARGVFHIESPAMTNLLHDGRLPRSRLPDRGRIDHPAGRGQRGQEAGLRAPPPGTGAGRRYAHPSLEPLLADTYGLMAYEEHILLVANGFAGHAVGTRGHPAPGAGEEQGPPQDRRNGRGVPRLRARRGPHGGGDGSRLGAARGLRRLHVQQGALGGLRRGGFPGRVSEDALPDRVSGGVLSSRRGFYAPIFYVLEALRCGARFLPPDVNLSEPRFLVRGDTIRLPLDQVKGLTPGDAGAHSRRAAVPAMRAISTGGRGRAHAEWLALLKVGALDSLGEPRGRLFWRLCRLEAAAPAASGSCGADGGARGPWRRVAREASSDGNTSCWAFPVSCHPLDYFAPKVDWSRYVPAAEIEPLHGQAGGGLRPDRGRPHPLAPTAAR